MQFLINTDKRVATWGWIFKFTDFSLCLNNYKCFGENNKMKDFSIRSKKKKEVWLSQVRWCIKIFHFLWVMLFSVESQFSWSVWGFHMWLHDVLLLLLEEKRFLWDFSYYFVCFCILHLTSLVSPRTPKINRSKFSWVLQQREDKDTISGRKSACSKAQNKRN